MKLSDFVIRDSIVVDLQATSKEEAIREMVGSLHKAGQLADGEVERVIRENPGREELGSTGIGMGVASTHTRCHTTTRLIGTVALSRPGSISRLLTASRSISSSSWFHPRTSPATISELWRIFRI